MPSPERNRLILLIALVADIGLGLASREIPGLFPKFLGKYPGDALWAIMVFLAVALIRPRLGCLQLGGIALGISYLDEFSQIYHAPGIDAIRRTTLGHLLLGSAFSWIDMAAYTLGIALAVSLDFLLSRSGGSVRSD